VLSGAGGHGGGRRVGGPGGAFGSTGADAMPHSSAKTW